MTTTARLRDIGLKLEPFNRPTVPPPANVATLESFVILFFPRR
jgi:hypothetical protein